MKNKFIVYLHSCWLSQLELTEIFSVETSAEEFYNSLNEHTLEKYVKNHDRREKIIENYSKLKTVHINTVLEKLNVNVIILWDDNYPENLKNIPHTPFVLYVRWNIPTTDMFGVVGSRKISEYWKKVIHNLVPEISKVFPIVSGWAAGCDSYAHKSSINSWNPTVVVVWTGIDEYYPVSNEKLFHSVVDSGWAVVSIFRIGEPWNPYNFPVRNEIVVWLSKWVLIIEAKEKSWSMITAWLTLDLWKDLYSVPWDIFSSNNAWTNTLIRNWEAKCVTSSIDILEEYNIEVKKSIHKSSLEFSDSIEQCIYESISWAAQNIDSLSDSLEITTQILLPKISMLELKWVIKKDLLWNYQLI